MPKRKAPEAATFGQRFVALRKAAAMTQQELADEVGVSRRMLAYYEGQSEHPPTTLLPALAQALDVSTDELLGLAPPSKPNGRVRDNRMQRRLQQIATLPPEERRQIMQLVDAFIELGKLKRRSSQATSGKGGSDEHDRPSIARDLEVPAGSAAGVEPMSEEEVAAEIKASRAERRTRLQATAPYADRS